MPGKRENRRPNSRPAPTFAMANKLIFSSSLLYAELFSRAGYPASFLDMEADPEFYIWI